MTTSSRPHRLVTAVIGPILALGAAVSGPVAVAATISKTLPDTAAGQIGGMVIARINADSPDAIQQWASTILSPAMDAETRAGILKQLLKYFETN